VASGHKLSQPTVDSYLEYFCASFLFYAAQRFDVRDKENLRSLSKYYAVDLGLRNHILGFRSRDRGYILENIVFLELRRRGYDVYVGKLYDKEIDFVAQRAQEMLYVQVAETVIDPAVLERELKPLQKADGYYGRLLLTRDYGINDSYEGIAHKNIIEWLLEDY
jgi:predicted AAA+ superfamily ATPase